MTDPVHGVMPKITYHIPEVGDTEMAKGEGGPASAAKARTQLGASRRHWQRRSNCSQRRACRKSTATPTPARRSSRRRNSPHVRRRNRSRMQTFKIRAAAPTPCRATTRSTCICTSTNEAAPADTQDTTADRCRERRRRSNRVADRPALRSPPPAVRRSHSAAATERTCTSRVNRPSYPANANSGARPANQPANTRRRAPISAWLSARKAPISRQPHRATRHRRRCSRVLSSRSDRDACRDDPQTAANRYAATGYGGQAVGATGPNAAAAGSNPYAVRQAAITEPQLPPHAIGRSHVWPAADGRAAHGRNTAASAVRTRNTGRPSSLCPDPDLYTARRPGMVRRSCSHPIRTSRPCRRCPPIRSCSRTPTDPFTPHDHRPGRRYGRRVSESANRPADARRGRELRCRPRRPNSARRTELRYGPAIPRVGTTSSAAAPGAAAASGSASRPPPAPRCSATWSASPNRICWTRRTAWV